MMVSPRYCTTTVGGRPAARVERPAALGALICRASSPVLCIGRLLADTSGPAHDVLGHLTRIVLARQIPTISVPQVRALLAASGLQDTIVLSLMEAGQRLTDPAWKPSLGRAAPDLAIFAGVPRMIGDLLFSGLRAGGSPGFRTVSLDRSYQPHATLSFPDLSMEEWVRYIAAVAKGAGIQ